MECIGAPRGEPDFQETRAPSRAELEGLLDKIIARLLKMLTRHGHLVEEQGMTYIADIDADNPLASLQAASCTYRIALGPRAGQKVLSLRTLPMHLPARAGSTTLPSPSGRRVGDEGRDATAHAPWRLAGRNEKTTAALCADAHGFSLHAGMRCGAHQRKELERLCRNITRPAIANERLKRDGAGDIVLQLKSAWRDGTTHIKMSPLEFMQRLAALVPRPRLHLIRFHGILAPNARLRAVIVPGAPEKPGDDAARHAHEASARMDWARWLDLFQAA